MAFHFAERVNRFVLRFVVSARADLAQQAHGEKLDAAHEQSYGQQKQRPMLGHQILVIRKLVNGQENAQRAAEPGSGESQQAKKLKPTCRIIEKESPN